ncbi:hypothetical protein [Bacillus massiliigorillae]|uniref:hypothetical protein n=1 Tax=Bacillus massiliigorillae TaxID=1243664 RepID=UPI0005A997C8|nr:hypothetical protein [Bacillus massiliigorillae]
MTFLLLIAGIAVNTILCVFTGGSVVIGLVFSLIGLPHSNSKNNWFSMDTIKFVLTILFTLLTLIIFMLITYASIRTAGTLAFSRLDLFQAKKMLLLGFIQGVFSLTAFKWPLPRFLGALKLDTKHKWVIASGSVLSITGGGITWLYLM